MDVAINERLKDVVRLKAKSVRDFALTIGVKPVTLNQQIVGTRGVSLDVIEATLCAFEDINTEWLITGEGDMLKSGKEDTKDEYRPRIPVSAAAGSLTGFADCVNDGDCEMLPLIKAFPPYDYTMPVKGDSMEPKFEGGDEIAIRRVVDVIEWGKPYVLDTRDGAVLKRLYDGGDTFRCVSYNKDYPDFEVSKEDVFGVYKVVGLLRI